MDRRRVLRNTAIGLPAVALSDMLTPKAAAATTAPAAASTAAAEIVLLGTAGGPLLGPGRTGISSALVVDGHVYLIDAGHGTVDQFVRAGLPITGLTGIFVTHLHSDHITDLYSLLWLTTGGIGTVGHPVDVHGPGRAGYLPAPFPSERNVATVSPRHPTPGLADLIRLQTEATAYDINIRIRDEAWPDPRPLIRPHEIRIPRVGASARGPVAPPMRPFKIFTDDRVRVTATLVDHAPVFPSFAYRFDTAYGSVVFSGDTAPSENLITLARGADILVHEAIDVDIVRASGLDEAKIRHLLTSHTDSTVVGSIAARAGVHTLLLNHLSPGNPALVPDATWLRKATTGYTGTVLIGNDLQRLTLHTPTGIR
jgi:ribonuclease BN (tRNA processing enzyme)